MCYILSLLLITIINFISCSLKGSKRVISVPEVQIELVDKKEWIKSNFLKKFHS